MRCEICGSQIRGRPYYKIVEGGKMTVCARCSKFGSAEWDPSRARVQQRRRPISRRVRNEIEVSESLELVEEYGVKIRKARQKMKLTIEDLSRRIGEKESVIKKLEKEEVNPDLTLVQKIKNVLNVELLVSEEASGMPIITRPVTGRSLGDIIKLSQSEDSDENED
jgi:putative transcription factor